ACWALLHLRVVIVPIVVATLVASALLPLVDRLARRIGRLAATALTFLGCALLGAAVIAVIVPPFIDQLDSLGSELDESVTRIENWAQDGPLGLDADRVDDLRSRVDDAGQAVLDASSGGLMRGVSLLVEIVAGALLAVALTFFLTKDGPAIWRWASERVAPQRRATADAAVSASIRTMRRYLAGVCLAGTVDAVLIGVGLVIIGVPLALPLAVLTFFGAFLPVVGATVSGALAAMIALVSGGPGDALLVIGLAVVVQQVEGDVIVPVVMGRQVRVHAALVLLALTAGGAVAGIVGAFVSVPILAVISTVAHEIRVRAPERWKRDIRPFAEHRSAVEREATAG
ncbi:MAG: AI-2E family transporter, partial [Actinomycetota bacterium]|nr:AI-2E family transporter [Actinomycetota bacterium]